jgi:hypothetical protein
MFSFRASALCPHGSVRTLGRANKGGMGRELGPRGRISASVRTQLIRMDARQGERGGQEEGAGPHGRADLPPSNFITDATMRPRHGRPSGHRPTVRSFVRPQLSA